MTRHNCRACRDTGWLPVPDPDSRNRPWSAACLCAKGEGLAQPRTVQGRTVRFAQATRDQWLAALKGPADAA